ncbi:MAG: type II toxin-antitoxin system HicA family toxin [Phycisphaeraceae bacterium]
MSRLPNLTARQVVQALHRAGFEEDHQTGSHLILRHPVTLRLTMLGLGAIILFRRRR